METSNLHQLTLARSQLYCAGGNGSLSYYHRSRVPAPNPSGSSSRTPVHAKTSPTTDVNGNPYSRPCKCSRETRARNPNRTQTGKRLCEYFERKKLKGDVYTELDDQKSSARTRAPWPYFGMIYQIQLMEKRIIRTLIRGAAVPPGRHILLKCSRKRCVYIDKHYK